MNWWYMGADPGLSGAFALINGHDGEALDIIRGDATEHDQAFKLDDWNNNNRFQIRMCLTEEVHSMPKQGIASSFKFGKSYGFMLGLLVANNIPHEFVTPVKWQNEMRCRSKGDKNVTKAAAQRIFSGQINITHRNADALLLAECCRRRMTSGGEDEKIRRSRRRS